MPKPKFSPLVKVASGMALDEMLNYALEGELRGTPEWECVRNLLVGYKLLNHIKARAATNPEDAEIRRVLHQECIRDWIDPAKQFLVAAVLSGDADLLQRIAAVVKHVGPLGLESSPFDPITKPQDEELFAIIAGYRMLRDPKRFADLFDYVARVVPSKADEANRKTVMRKTCAKLGLVFHGKPGPRPGRHSRETMTPFTATVSQFKQRPID